MIANSPIKCEKEYLQEDGRYMHREKTYTRIAMNKREKTHSRRW